MIKPFNKADLSSSCHTLSKVFLLLLSFYFSFFYFYFSLSTIVSSSLLGFGGCFAPKEEFVVVKGFEEVSIDTQKQNVSFLDLRSSKKIFMIVIITSYGDESFRAFIYQDSYHCLNSCT